LPSIVSFPAGAPALFGRDAERRLPVDAEQTIYSVKRFMGQGIDDVGDEAVWFPFRVSGEPGEVLRIGLGAGRGARRAQERLGAFRRRRDSRAGRWR
jgi:molecular chaperone DnaK